MKDPHRYAVQVSDTTMMPIAPSAGVINFNSKPSTLLSPAQHKLYIIFADGF